MYKTMPPGRANTGRRGLIVVVGPRTSKTGDLFGTESMTKALQTAIDGIPRMRP
jgi:hypothetical protein